MRNYFFALLLCISTTVFSQKTLIYCGQLIDVNNLQVLKDMTIVTDGNKIEVIIRMPNSQIKIVVSFKNIWIKFGLIQVRFKLVKSK